jgi:hypothetical protein
MQFPIVSFWFLGTLIVGRTDECTHVTLFLARHASVHRHAPLQILASSWWPRPGYGSGSLESRDPLQQHHRQPSTVTELTRASCATGACISWLYMLRSTCYNVLKSCYRFGDRLVGRRRSFGYSCSTGAGMARSGSPASASSAGQQP